VPISDSDAPAHNELATVLADTDVGALITVTELVVAVVLPQVLVAVNV
jgi:hypothetical protein